MTQNIKVFTSKSGSELIIKHRKSAVIFEMNPEQLNNKHNVVYEFDIDTFKEVLDYLETVSNKSWGNIIPKETNSLGSDYYEYYDKELDNNGYLGIEENKLDIDRPFLESNKLYQFNKRKMESFIYDFRKKIDSLLV